MAKPVTILLFPVFITLVFGSFGFIAYQSEHRIRKAGVPVVASVVDHSLESSHSNTSQSRNNLVWYPIVEFTTAQGHKASAKYPEGSREKTKVPGETVEILYSPDDPRQIVTQGNAYRIPKWIAGGLVVMWLIAGLVLAKRKAV